MALLRIPTESEAVAAAIAVAGEHGVICDVPEVLHSAGNIWVHLAPAPVVAQVPKDVVAVRGPSAETHLRRDLEVCSWLAERDLPVGAPSDLLPPGPHQHDGLLVAFFTHYPKADGPRDDYSAGRALRLIHEALVDYPASLREHNAYLQEPRRLLGLLAAGKVLPANQLRLLRNHLEAAELRVDGVATRPVHGDVHLQNVAWTSGGPLWTDWEDICLAPLAWDFACLATSTSLYGIPADRLGAALSGYGAKLDGRALLPYVHLRVVQVSSWAATRAAHDQRAAKRLADGLKWLRHRHL